MLVKFMYSSNALEQGPASFEVNTVASLLYSGHERFVFKGNADGVSICEPRGHHLLLIEALRSGGSDGTETESGFDSQALRQPITLQLRTKIYRGSDHLNKVLICH
jgi:hypothetical protein